MAGTPLPNAYTSPDVELVQKGCSNLARHIQNTRKYGVPVVVAINQFASDSQGKTGLLVGPAATCFCAVPLCHIALLCQ